MATLASLIVRVSADTRDFEQRMTRARNQVHQTAAKFNRFGTSAMGLGRSLTMGVTVPIIGLGVLSVNAAAKFQTSMAQVQVATDASGKEMKGLSKLAKKMGADTIFSAGESADAMLNLAKAGMTPAQIKAGALKSTLDLAAASGMDLAESAIVMGAGMNTFGLKARDSKRIVDALAGAANASSAEVSDLALALQQAGTTAASSGQSIEQTTAALAAMADAGIRGSDAGTSLKTFMARLIPVSADAATEMKNLGLSFFDARGKMKSLKDISGELKKGFAGLTDEQRLSKMQTIFGSDAIRAATVLYGQGSEGLAKYIEATSKSGAAGEMAGARMGGMSGALETMKGSLETAALTIGETLAPMVRKIAGFITNLTNKFSALPSGLKKTIMTLGLVAAAMGPALVVFGSLISSIGSIAGACTAASAAIATAGGLMAVLSGPVAIAVAAILALVAAGWLIYRNWDQISKAVKPIVQSISAFFVQQFGVIRSWVEENMPLIKATVQTVMTAIKAIFERVWPVISAATRVAWGVIKTVISTSIIAVLGVIKATMQLIQGDWSGAWETMKKTVGDILNSLKTTVSAALESVKTAALTKLAEWKTAISQWFISQKQALIERLAEWKGAILDWLSGMPAAIVAGLVAWGVAIRDWTISTHKENMAQLSQWGAQIIGWFTGMPARILVSLIKWKETIVTWFTTTKVAIGVKLAEWGASIMTWISEIPGKFRIKLDAWWTDIKSWFESIPTKIKTALVGWWENIRDWFKNLGANSIREVEKGITEQRATFIDKLGTFMLYAILAVPAVIAVSLLALGIKIIKLIIEGIGNAKEALKDAFVGAIQSAFDALSNIRFPHIPLPHLKMTGSWDLTPPSLSVPSVGVDWYAKGAVFNRPSVIGVGEAGPEAVIPLSKLPGIIAQGASQQTPNKAIQIGSITINANSKAEGCQAADGFTKRIEELGFRTNILARTT